MKLRKQAPAKALIVLSMLGLLLAFFGLMRSEPRIKAAEGTQDLPRVDYRRFFAPGQAPPDAPPAPAQPASPHTRTRAS